MKALWLTLFAALCSWSMAQSPEDVIKRFVDALNKKDLGAASKCMHGGLVSPFIQERLKEGGWPTLSVSNIKPTIVGKLALVTFNLASIGPGATPDMEDYLVLSKSETGWLIDVSEQRGGLGLMAWMLSDSPIMSQAIAASRRSTCVLNVKQLAVALILFQTDHDDVLKLTASNWRQKIAPYMKGKNILSCPEDAKGAVSYSFNERLAGKSGLDMEDLTNTVLVYEGSSGKLTFRHSGKATIAFADGHAQLVTPEEAKKLRWKP